MKKHSEGQEQPVTQPHPGDQQAMRILHLGKYCPPFFGGIENFMMDLAESCAVQGAEVAAICHHHEKGGRFDKRRIRSVDVYRVPTYGQLMFAPVSPAFGYYLDKVIESFKPDVLHIHMPNTSAFFALFSARARRLKWVVHWHSDVLGDDSPWFLRLFYPAYRVFESSLMRRAADIIATSPPYMAISPVLQRFKHKCQVIPLGIKPLPEVESTRNRQTLQLLMVGRLTYYKGHRYVIEALAELSKRGVVDVTLNVVGTGEHQEAIERLVEQHQLNQCVRLLGKLDYHSLLEQLKSADVLLLPSIERTEAFGVVLLEAACYGVPAIVSDVPGSGMSWVVEDGHTGLVVERKNPLSLVEAIDRLNRDRELLAKLAKQAGARFDQSFSIDKIGRKMLQLYRKWF